MEDRNDETPCVRSRWTPKQEQILILESLFENGVVNPPKDETTRIRRLLENYGPVVDANVFYWFQNRRSRSRRRTRQIQAKIDRDQLCHDSNNFQNSSSSSFVLPGQEFYSSLSLGDGSSNSTGGAVNDLQDDPFAFSGQVSDYSGIEHNSGANSSFANYMSPAAHIPNTNYQTVFINGVATEVAMGPQDMKRMFGEEDLVLFHSSGVQVSDFAFSSALQHGESYFLREMHPRQFRIKEVARFRDKSKVQAAHDLSE